ncbi:MAG: DODA-type extradiol aromatic ring-opening family dioxygenase [Leptolyngbyaceae cyanobacterium]
MPSTSSLANRHILYISHGGGPLPLLDDPQHRDMVANLQAIAAQLPRPKAIVVISAHWEAAVPTLTAGTQPPLIYDYYGFPKSAYQLTYPAPGHPALAAAICELLQTQGLEVRLTTERGFDHGLFVPLKIMYPAADIPCVQLSLVKGLDAKTHIVIGQALSQLAADNVLILGSGFSFHNMQAFQTPDTAQTRAQNEAFEQWLIETCANPDLATSDRTHRLINWETAPAARYCHPREEHLLPLHVCYGAAQQACREYFELTVLGKKASVYLW